LTLSALTVDCDRWDLGVYRLLQCRRQRIEVIRIDDNAVDALGDRSFQVGALFRRRALSVALHDCDIAEPVRFVLNLAHHVYEERKRQIWNRREDRQVFARGFGRGCGYERQARCDGQ
jgi:hypothetical protein